MGFFKKIRYIAGIFWHFRYYALSVTLALLFWETPLIKPFRFFVVLVHEVNHAGAALLTGGQVVEMRT
ncbi:MAG: M50 family metallopeptidase, partial [Candidatus Latescibacterota bacterium]|nr:M50 family metallopeptidase [Candidatus Latescibacterota bacterium]